MKNGLDEQYIDLLKDILENGLEKNTRNGKVLSVFGRSIRYKFKDGKFPLITTKKMPFKTIVTELLWFLRGDTNIKFLVDNNCHIWDGDAYKNWCKQFEVDPNNFDGEEIAKGHNDQCWGYPILDHVKPTSKEYKRGQINAYLEGKAEKPFFYLTQEEFINKIKTDDEFAKKWGDLGPVYGKQWRNWKTVYDSNISKWNGEGENAIPVFEVINKHDQITNLINDLKTNPDSRRLMVNAWNVGELGSMVLPPCFSEDMMVCCIDGYRKISELTINDLVLTEDGSYQKVYDLHETSYNGELLNIKIHGNNKIITVTPNHPFLIKNKGYITASEIDKDDYVGIPINKNEIIPSFDVVIKDNQYSEKLVTTILDDIDYWFLMGYYMGDGWLIDSKEEVYFTINNNQVDEILPRLKKIIGLAKLNNSGKNCTKYVGKKKQVFEILSKFGKYAEGKFIPQFVHDAPKHLINEFIKGYLMADGCITNDGTSYTTVSENIAFGMQLLYAKLGIKASVFYQKRPNKKIIEGREVNQKNTFSINVYKQKNKSKNYIFDENYLWLKITNITSEYKDCFVYNISTENNHTYNVYNIINHNCHYGFQVYTRELSNEERVQYLFYKTDLSKLYLIQPTEEQLNKENIPTRAISLMWNQRSVDTFLGLPFNIASYGLLLEIIAKAVNMVPDELIGNLGDTHLYLNHIEQAKEQIGRELSLEERNEIHKNLAGHMRYHIDKLDLLKKIDYSGDLITHEILDELGVPKRKRQPYSLPTLKIENEVKWAEGDCLPTYSVNDFTIENYQSHPAIKAPLSN